MAVLGDDGIVHVDWAEQRLVMIHLGENIIGHVDYAQNIARSWLTLNKTSLSSWTTQNIVWSWQTSKTTSLST